MLELAWRRSRALAALACVIGLAPVIAMPAAAAAPTAGNAMWDLTDLYPSPEAWSDAYARTSAAVGQLDHYKGTLGASAASLLAALDAISSANKESSRLFTYASLKRDEDLRIAVNQERFQRAQVLGTQVGENTAWLAPEIIALGADKVRAFQAAEPALTARFGFQLDNILRAAPHTLGVEAETVLAATGNVLQQPDTMRGVLASAELPFPTVTLSSGAKVRLDDPAYDKYRQSGNRADRKLVFDAFWGAWKKFEGTFGAMLTTQVMGDAFRAKTSKFNGSLDAALFADNMPEAVYRTLVAEAHAGLPTLHRYLRLRKQMLGIKDELQLYDNYPPLFSLHPEPTFSVDDAKRITLDALQPLGEDYLGLLRHGFEGRWMNVEPHPGKASGAYMNGSAYDVHPYLLLNHNGDYESLSTIAHEWGHAVHTLLADRAQPFEKSSYSTFIAESASIGNEMLLADYMVAHAQSRAQKLYYLGIALESIRTTFFRQVMFAEFELAIHEELEQGRALSGARMTEMYCSLVRTYYGEAQGVMKIDPAYCIEWAFIPHFYYDFYVYQYATSMAGAAFFTDAILNEGDPARDRFLAMLRAGGSDYAYELYKRAGLDMATPAPYRLLVARMNRLLDEIEALQKSPGKN